jgi:hypothetical protein
MHSLRPHSLTATACAARLTTRYGRRAKEEVSWPYLDLENSAEAVNWHIEVIQTHPPKVKLTALMRSPADPPVPLTTGLGQTIEIKMAPEVAQELSDLLGRVLNPG